MSADETIREALLALAAKAEAATAADRELDAEIACVMHPPDRRRLNFNPLRREVFHLGLLTPAWVDWDSVASFHPSPTASLDAAAALVPEGWAWHSAMRPWFTPVGATGSVWGRFQKSTTFTADAATPALALTAAALRARAAMMGD